jgi:proline racemase
MPSAPRSASIPIDVQLTGKDRVMRFSHAFKAIDSHTGGAPTRTVFSGVPPVPGRTMIEKREYIRANLDWIPGALTHEPRGHSVASVVLLLPPCDPRADVGVVFVEPFGYPPMCGTDAIGVSTVLVETGQIQAREPETTIRIDTPAGLIDSTVLVEGGEVVGVQFVGAPSFLLHPQVAVDLEGYGRVVADIAYGGNFYAITDAAQFGLRIAPDNIAEGIALANRLRPVFEAAVRVQHPTLPEIKGLTHVQFFGPPEGPTADLRILVVMEPGAADRSPCGTGTSAKVATLIARGELGMGEPLVHESITGATFRGRAVEALSVGKLSAVRVEITGRAFLTADSTFLVDPRDPLAHGFLVR